MGNTIGLIHVTLNSVSPINQAFQAYAPETTVLNFLDEGLIQEVNRVGEIKPYILRRFITLLEKAVESNVDGILVCCTVFTPYIKDLSNLFEIPIIANDYAMLNKAVETGSNIGLIATVETAGPTSEKLLHKIAQTKNKTINIKTVVLPKAFQALKNGDVETHDHLIHEKISELKVTSDVIVLAQISMISAASNIGQQSIPILTSENVGIHSILALVNK